MAVGLAGAALLFGGQASAITIQFDYRLDASGLFGSPEAPTPARTALEFAARAFTSFTDALEAIQPGGANSWTALVRHPGDEGDAVLGDLAVPADTLLVFAAARDLSPGQLAEGSIGRVSGTVAGAPAFIDAVFTRGEGDAALDVGSWGGSISFDTRLSDGSPRRWHFGVDSRPPADAYDFYTVAVHELAHVLGFGTSLAFTSNAVNGQFIGAVAQQLYQGPVPLAGQHFAFGVTSPPFAGEPPKPSLGPSLALGERNLFTPLDYAAMADLGWSVPAALLGLPGDVDQDFDVDGADFLAWQRNLGGAGGSEGDVNGDFVVDEYDAWIVRHYLGSTAAAPPLSAASRPVPEPSLATPALVAALAVAAARRRTEGTRAS